jgi:hypothetical protein
MHRPWRDANRRTSFLWAATNLRAFGFLIRVDTPDARAFKESVKQRTFSDVHGWFEREVQKTRSDAA